MNIIYIITSIVLILSYLLMKKEDKKYNIIHSIIISAIIFLTYNIFISTIMFFTYIKSTLLNLSILNIVFSIYPIHTIRKNKEIQKYYLNKIDLIAVIIILVSTITIAILNYGTNIAVKHAVTDAATLDAFNPLATIVNAVPSNIAAAFSSNNSILAVVVVAIIIGLCMNALGEKADPLKKVLESVNEIIQLYLTFLINKVGPIAIFCLISRTFAIYGTEYLAPAAAYIVAAMVTLFVLVVTIYPIGIWVTTKMNPIQFIKKIAKVGVFGFSTNSSAACLPLNTRTCIDELGCSEEITSFVLPTGMTINMNGTTVMHMFAATFIATSAGIDVTPANLATIAFLSICAAMGCPAIPIAGTTLIVTILSGLGWTSDACMIAYALVVAINRPVEMALLPLNVIGDATVNVIVNAKEKELDKEKYNS